MKLLRSAVAFSIRFSSRICSFVEEKMRDLCVEMISKVFGILGFLETMWRLFLEVVWPPHHLKSVEGQVRRPFISIDLLI